MASRSGLLPPCVVPALGLRLIIQSVNEMPPAQIDGIVQGVYFALRRRPVTIKRFPHFNSQGQKQGKTELFIAVDLREM